MNTLAQENLRLAVLDDDALYRDMLCASVSRLGKFEIFQATSGAELERVLATEKIDCIAMDFDLGIESGLLVKERIDISFPDHAPTILMTGTGSEITAVRAFRMGMADYLSKRLTSPAIFVETVLKTVERDRKQLLAKAELRKLTEDAALDSITGLEGRARLDERLNQLASLLQPVRSVYALLVIELAEYHAILESFGLKTADKALRAFADKLRQLVRTQDVLGRYGDNMFLGVANLTADDETLDKLTMRLRRELEWTVKLDVAEVRLSAIVRTQFCSPGSSTALLGDPRLPPRLRNFLQAIENESSSSPAPAEAAIASAPLSTLSRTLKPAMANVTPAAEILRNEERRGSPRHRVFKRGLIRILEPSGFVHCNIRNISESGAGMRVDFPFAVPAIFDLEIIGSGEIRRVQLRWMLGCDLGVQFLGPKVF